MAQLAQPFPFMALPVEIRIMIYSQIVVSLREIFPAPGKSLFRTSDISHSTIMALFLVSKTVFNEAMPLYYSKNHFYLTTSQDLYFFLSSVGHDRCKYLKTLNVQYTGKWAVRAFRLLLERCEIKNLKLLVHNSAMQGQPPHTKSVVTSFGMRQLKQLRGLETLQIGFAWSRHLAQHAHPFYSTSGRALFIETLQVTKQPKALLEDNKSEPESATSSL